MRNLFGGSDNKEDKTKAVENGKLRLHQEELDIAKNRVQTGAVTLSKEIVEEQKMVNVPVTHEEVIIERRAISNEASDTPITAEGVIRIPVSKEQVEVGKHTVITGEVSAYKREVEENEKVEETLKREEARVNTIGDPNIVTDNSAFH